MEKLLSTVLSRIVPSKTEQEKDKRMLDEIFRELRKFKIEPILVGSLAKKTDLAGDKDADIFIRFHKDVSRKELEERGLEIGKKLFVKLNAKYEIDYAEHPYVIGNYKGFKVEIVPCYDVVTPQSAVDRTPLHTEYVKGRVWDNEILRNEIRLLKKFMKGAGVYGAEAKVQGFSGYLTELLVLQYGTFERTLRNVAKWKHQEMLDPEHHWKDSQDLRFFFPDANLIVVDPVDKDRNVAASISKQKLSEFIIASRKFLQSPNEKFFFPKAKNALPKEKLWSKMKARETKILAIIFNHERINPNMLYAQLRKTKKSLEKNILDKGFKIMRSYEWSNDKNHSIILFEFLVWKLPKVEHRLGPLIISKEEDQAKFLEKYKNAYIEGDRYVVDKQRESSDASELLEKIAKDEHGFGKNLRNAKLKILKDKEILSFKDNEFLIFMSEIFK